MNKVQVKPGVNRRLLVVDDNRDIHDDIIKILAPASNTSALDEMEAELFGKATSSSNAKTYEIDSAYQGEEALALVEQALQQGRPYAMAFIDMRMPPGWDGVETIEQLWQADAELQVVICTAYSDHSWSEIAARLGESDQLLILKKPFDTVEISQMALALTHKWALQREVKQHILDLDRLVEERTEALEKANQQLKKEMLEHERMETELRLAQKLESIGQLAAGIAHEINTPTQYVGDNTRFLEDAFADMLNITGAQNRLLEAARQGTVAADLINEVEATIESADLEYLSEEIPRAISQSLEGTTRIAKIVTAMKQFSHPGREEKEAVDLNRVIDSTTTVSSNEWKYVAEMKTELDAALPMVSGYAAELGQVFLNLIVNAAHAIAGVVGDSAEQKGLITVSTACVEGMAEVRITDTGTGIPESIRSKVFDPFFTTKEVGKGTGQGLHIAHSVVVDKHGGTLALESEVGVGTTFIVRLPLQESALVQQDKVA